MRIRIALSAAVAVLVFPSVVYTYLSSTPAAAAKVRHEAGTRHRGVHRQAGARHRAVRIDSKLTSFSAAQKTAAAQQAAEAQKAAQLTAFANAVTKSQEENFLKEYAFLQEYAYLKAFAAQRAATAQQAAAAAAARGQAAAAPVLAPASTAGVSDATSTNTADWACIRAHESGGNYSVGGGGAYQFELGTWEGLTGLSTPAENSPAAVQDAAALRLYSERGWEPWTTRVVCGL